MNSLKQSGERCDLKRVIHMQAQSVIYNNNNNNNSHNTFQSIIADQWQGAFLINYAQTIACKYCLLHFKSNATIFIKVFQMD